MLSMPYWVASEYIGFDNVMIVDEVLIIKLKNINTIFIMKPDFFFIYSRINATIDAIPTTILIALSIANSGSPDEYKYKIIENASLIKPNSVKKAPIDASISIIK